MMQRVGTALRYNGWTVGGVSANGAIARKRLGDEEVVLRFKPQMIYAVVNTPNRKASSTVWLDVQKVAKPYRWASRELPRLIEHFADVRLSRAWHSKPKGWTDKSRAKAWNTLTKDAPKHPVSKCMNEMEGKVDDPGAFCSSMSDRVRGTAWRKKKKAQELSPLTGPQIRSVAEQVARTTPGLTLGPYSKFVTEDGGFALDVDRPYSTAGISVMWIDPGTFHATQGDQEWRGDSWTISGITNPKALERFLREVIRKSRKFLGLD